MSQTESITTPGLEPISSAPVRLESVTKIYGEARAVDAIDLLVQEGSLTTLLGPSGCGKTTTLRMVAGFATPDEGSVHIGDENVTRLEPNVRPTRTVFQNYALFPHMSVHDNVAFGLQMQHVSRGERRERTEEALSSVGLEGLGERRPGQLSGGQQQRVALARALVTRPKVLLLDEPLSNLDAKLRVQMRAEIRRLQAELGITTIYVTHDQEEALSLSDRVAVMNKGNILQVGSPSEIYERPATRFVAEFLGVSNFLPATVQQAASRNLASVEIAGEAVEVECAVSVQPGEQLTVTVRPEHLRLVEPGAGVSATIDNADYLGAVARYTVEIDSIAGLVVVDDPAPFGGRLRRPGDKVGVTITPGRGFIGADHSSGT